MCVLLYLLFFVSGKDVTLPASSSVTESVVLELAKGLENRGHNLYCDNYYTSIRPCNSLGSVPAGWCGATDGESPRK